jgi:pyruvate ferredoxin oxidoreductase delta subunit
MELGAIIKHDQKKAPKTGSWRYMKPEVDKEKCIGCSTCVPFCPEATIEIHPVKSSQSEVAEGEFNRVKDKKAEIDYEYCKGCGVCAQVCPVKAILMKKN